VALGTLGETLKRGRSHPNMMNINELTAARVVRLNGSRAAGNWASESWRA